MVPLALFKARRGRAQTTVQCTEIGETIDKPMDEAEQTRCSLFSVDLGASMGPPVEIFSVQAR